MYLLFYVVLTHFVPLVPSSIFRPMTEPSCMFHVPKPNKGQLIQQLEVKASSIQLNNKFPKKTNNSQLARRDIFIWTSLSTKIRHRSCKKGSGSKGTRTLGLSRGKKCGTEPHDVCPLERNYHENIEPPTVIVEDDFCPTEFARLSIEPPKPHVEPGLVV